VTNQHTPYHDSAARPYLAAGRLRRLFRNYRMTMPRFSAPRWLQPSVSFRATLRLLADIDGFPVRALYTCRSRRTPRVPRRRDRKPIVHHKP